MPEMKRAALPLMFAALHVFMPALEAQEAHERLRSEAVLENLVVTASRVAVPAEEVGSSITVISRAELEVRQPTFVSDALRDVPGIAVSRGGGFGAVTQVRMRGSEGNHALVLIDGIEANNPVSNSEFDFANLLVAEIERIEILRGAQSALYGSDAVGGVINIITREHDAGSYGRVHGETGTFGTRSLGASMGGGSERFTGGASITRFETEGQNIARSGSESDGFANDALTLQGRALIGDAWSVKGNLRYIDSEQDFDSQDFSFPPSATQGLVVDDDVWSNIEQSFARMEATADFARLQHRFGVSGTSTENTFFDDGLLTGRNAGDKTKLDYQLTLQLSAGVEPASGARPDPELLPEPGSRSSPSSTAGVGSDSGKDRDHALTVALERELIDYRNSGATPDAPENQKRSDAQSSIVAEYRATLARAGFSASVRFDENELFENASTYRVTGSYSVNARTRLHSSLGTGVSNPGFFDLFGFFPGSFIGNPALKPERSTNFDVGVERAFGEGIRLDVTYFLADLEDEIQTTFDSRTFLSSVMNLNGESERRGAELSLSAHVTDRWQVAASYTYLDAAEPDGAVELRRPRSTASLDNTFEFLAGRGRLNVGIDHSGKQFDNELVFATPEERVALSAFTLVNLAGELRLSPRWRVHARVENLFDEDYEEWFAYRGRDRAIVAGFSVDLGR